MVGFGLESYKDRSGTASAKHPSLRQYLNRISAKAVFRQEFGSCRTKHLVQCCPEFKQKLKCSLPVTSAHPVLCSFALPYRSRREFGCFQVKPAKKKKKKNNSASIFFFLFFFFLSLGFSINSQTFFQSKFS